MRWRVGVAIDMGTVNTRVCAAGRGLLVDEPSAVAVDRTTGGVIAVGHAADALAGKQAQDVEVIHPLKDGVVADLDAAAAMLQGFLRKAKLGRSPVRSAAVVCVPGAATSLQRRSLAVVAGAPRPRLNVRLIDAPVAAAAGAGFDLAAGAGGFVVDIGGGHTEAAVLAGGHVVRARSLRAGGSAMDEAIVQAVKGEMGLLLGRDAARSLKMPFGLSDSAAAPAEAVGVDAAQRTPRVERVPAALVTGALGQAVTAIVGAVREMLSDIPPHLAADVVRGKIRLVGGGSLLPGLAARIEAAAGIPAVVVDDPLHCTVRGAADALEPGAGLTFTERPDTAGYLAPAANENPVL
jgi:rod shape-determining protein MreB and related proteins